MVGIVCNEIASHYISREGRGTAVLEKIALLDIPQVPYTPLSPKKVFLQHLHHHDSRAVTRSVFAVGAVDSVRVDGLLAGKDPLWEAKPLGWEWQVDVFWTENRSRVEGGGRLLGKNLWEAEPLGWEQKPILSHPLKCPS